MTTSIPDDIVHEICSYAREGSLTRMALCNKSLLEIARPHLYGQLHPCTTACASQLLSTSRHLLRYTRSLIALQNPCCFIKCDVLVELFHTVLEHHTLHHFKFDLILTIPPGMLPTLFQILRLPNLRSVSSSLSTSTDLINNTHLPSWTTWTQSDVLNYLSNLLSCRAIRHLEMPLTFFSENQTIPLRSPLPKLDTLSLKVVKDYYIGNVGHHLGNFIDFTALQSLQLYFPQTEAAVRILAPLLRSMPTYLKQLSLECEYEREDSVANITRLANILLHFRDLQLLRFPFPDLPSPKTLELFKELVRYCSQATAPRTILISNMAPYGPLLDDDPFWTDLRHRNPSAWIVLEIEEDGFLFHEIPGVDEIVLPKQENAIVRFP